MNPKITKTIKITSTLLISGALGLEFWNMYLYLHHSSLPAGLKSLFWLGNAALIAHGVEGIVAALKASSQDKNPLIYGIYTFFVGFPGLQELELSK